MNGCFKEFYENEMMICNLPISRCFIELKLEGITQLERNNLNNS